MKKLNLIAPFVLLSILLVSISCNQVAEAEEECTKVENTLKSMTLFSDTLNHEPNLFTAELSKVNDIIDSIGYPHAGYKLWVVQSDTFTKYRFMINGYWPDQAAYDVIHESDLFKNAWDDDLWEGIVVHSYNRFQKAE